MWKYKALYTDGLFKGMDFRTVEVFLVVGFVVSVLLAGAIFLFKAGDSEWKLKDCLLLVYLIAIPAVSFGYFCKNTEVAVKIVDVQSGKTTIVADKEVARRAIDALETIDYVSEINEEKYLSEKVVQEMLNK